MRFVVVGAGAIGAYVGACLADGGAEVTLVARGEHLKAMRLNGVQVEGTRRSFRAYPAVTDDIGAVSDCDIAILGVKAHSLPGIAHELSASLPSHATVLPAQNGVPWWFFHKFDGPLRSATIEAVDPDGVVAAAIPDQQVVACVVFCSTEVVAPGVVRHIEGTRFALGELDGSASDRCQAIAHAFIAGGLKCTVESRVRDQLWLKLIGNAAFNPVSAITGTTMGELGAVPELVEVLRTALEEGARVGQALGIELPVSVDRRLRGAFAVGDHKTSMLQDLEAGKPLELDCITGAVCEIARKLELDAPCLTTIYACAKGVEAANRAIKVAGARS